MYVIERAFEVNGNHCVPLLLGHLQHQCILCDAGVVNQNINRAEISLNLVDGCFGLCKVGSVAGVAFSLDT